MSSGRCNRVSLGPDPIADGPLRDLDPSVSLLIIGVGISSSRTVHRVRSPIQLHPRCRASVLRRRMFGDSTKRLVEKLLL